MGWFESYCSDSDTLRKPPIRRAEERIGLRGKALEISALQILKSSLGNVF